jgi:adenylyltransferase/sulfurtransferase
VPYTYSKTEKYRGLHLVAGAVERKVVVVRQISARELAREMANDRPVYLVDVRQPWEHELAALPNSVLIPLNELPGRTDEIQPPVKALLVVYCHHGMRSLSGAVILEQLGFPDVVSLAGGIDAWSTQVDPGIPRY